MLLAALIVLRTAPFSGAVWRRYEEVFDLANVGGKLLAATNGGLLQFNGAQWMALSSPSGLRSIEETRPFVVSNSSGKRFAFDGVKWKPCSCGERARDVDSGLEVRPEDSWLTAQPSLRAAFPTAPPAHVYSLIRVRTELLAGTSAGLYRYKNSTWEREILPTQLPVSRPNGIAEENGTFVVGGLDGLFVGGPGNWKQASLDAIRQVRQVGTDVWVVHGNGALDKLDPASDQFYPDVMTGDSKRPWTSCIGEVGKVLLLGGLGGWSERSVSTVEKFPPELAKDVVTAIAGRDNVRWIGTEQSGVLRFDSHGVHRWNPGNGLTDTWVTSLCRTPQGLVVGTMHSGLFRIVGDAIKPLPSPTQRVTQVTLWKSALAVGGMDGAWILQGSRWQSLGTQGEETTSFAFVGKRLAITTVSGAVFR